MTTPQYKLRDGPVDRDLTSDDAILVFWLRPADFERRVQDFSEAQVSNGSRG